MTHDGAAAGGPAMTREAIEARYQHVLAWRREGWSFRQIGAHVSLTHQRVRMIYAQALRWEASVAERLQADSPVEVLHVGRQAVMALRQSGLTTVEQVAALSNEELLGLRNIGPQSIAQIRVDLAARYDGEG